MKIFGRDFTNLDSRLIEDLRNLENDSAIYAHFWKEDCSSGYCRIRFNPVEIVDFVEAYEAYNEFLGYRNSNLTSEESLNKITNKKIRNRVLKYNEWAESIGQDTSYCPAGFLGEHLEDLVCGGIEERYEYLSQTYTGDRKFLLFEIFEMFPSTVRYLENRQANRPNYLIEQEQDVRDLLFFAIKNIFPDAKLEENTQSHAGNSKKIDIVIPKLSSLIEIKFVRDNQHSKKVADELKTDIESYHAHTDCKNIYLFVWDKENLLKDKENFTNELRGFRRKGDSEFSVEVFVKP